MNISVGNKILISEKISDYEVAWKIEDAILVLEYFKLNKEIVLGGDVLTEKKMYNYDNWYYEMNSDQTMQCNIDCSITVATEYIQKYINTNGKSFYVVFVTQNTRDGSEKTGDGSVS